MIKEGGVVAIFGTTVSAAAPSAVAHWPFLCTIGIPETAYVVYEAAW